MARISVNWEEPAVGGGYEGFDSEDMRTGLPAQYGDSGKPIVFYLASDLEEDALETVTVDGTVLRDEKVAIGMKMFNLVKMDGSRVDDDHPYHKILGGRELPRMVVVGSDGHKVGSLEGNIPPSKLFGLMKRAASKTYKHPIEKFVKEYQKVLTEIDKVEAAKTALATKRAASNDAPAARVRQWDDEEAELAQQEQEITATEAELLSFRMKDDKVAKGTP